MGLRKTRRIQGRYSHRLVVHHPAQCEALILIGGSGLPDDEAVRICGCAVGTIKSRVNRARNRLVELLSVEGAVEYGPEARWRPAPRARSKNALRGDE